MKLLAWCAASNWRISGMIAAAWLIGSALNWVLP